MPSTNPTTRCFPSCCLASPAAAAAAAAVAAAAAAAASIRMLRQHQELVGVDVCDPAVPPEVLQQAGLVRAVLVGVCEVRALARAACCVLHTHTHTHTHMHTHTHTHTQRSRMRRLSWRVLRSC
jgi:hypothetical protein